MWAYLMMYVLYGILYTNAMYVRGGSTRFQTFESAAAAAAAGGGREVLLYC